MVEIVAGVVLIVGVVYVALVWLPDFRADLRGIRARRARHDVSDVVEGPAPAKPGGVRRRRVVVADPEGPPPAVGELRSVLPQGLQRVAQRVEYLEPSGSSCVADPEGPR